MRRMKDPNQAKLMPWTCRKNSRRSPNLAADAIELSFQDPNHHWAKVMRAASEDHRLSRVDLHGKLRNASGSVQRDDTKLADRLNFLRSLVSGLPR
jgi:hypothetical protein